MILTFDDIPLLGGPALVSAPGFVDQGFQFSTNMVAIDLSTINAGAGTGFAALQDYGGPITISEADGGTFSFINTMMKGWNGGAGGTISGFANGQIVGSMSFSVLGPDAGGGHPVAYWTMVSPDFSNITSVVIDSTNPILLTSTQLTPGVPEPATIALMMTGMLLAMWFNRRVA